MSPTQELAGRTLRNGAADPAREACRRYPRLCSDPMTTDALFLDSREGRLIAWAGLSPWRPVLRKALNHPEILGFIHQALRSGGDGVLRVVDGEVRLAAGPDSRDVILPPGIRRALCALHSESVRWVGEMTPEGDYVFDPRAPAPGTHFRANLLVGDRHGFPNPLLTTPKAVVDGWGRGSSRAHADRQILATRWDMLPEENGFPANRQLYLVEENRQILYSAAPPADCAVRTRHAANRTTIRYELPDGLSLERTFFVLPGESGLPAAIEAQFVVIRNASGGDRELQLIMTGMFGFEHPGALVVDVIYTCVTVEPRIFHGRDGAGPIVVAPRYSPGWGSEDQPFNVTVGFRGGGGLIAPDGWCMDYQKFVGNGTLEQPENLLCLDNAYPKKGPPFFAIRLPVRLGAGESFECHSYNGLMSRHEGGPITGDMAAQRLKEFVSRAVTPGWGLERLHRVVDFHEVYRSAVQVKTPDPRVDALVNTELPFQIRYQTYASRSFALTQKGFRQIGFREIQDLFGALPFEVAAGRQEHVRDLIGTWAAHIHDFGYADHQFYWTGMEPGRYSDDALWLFQAAGRYVDLTGDAAILDAEWPVAGTNTTRRLFDTLEAVLRYSGEISVGRNGLPLLDRADWNDTLNLDGEGVHGPQKEAEYKRLVAEGRIRDGDPYPSDLSESVMNGFLLEIARQYMVRFARMKGDAAAENRWGSLGEALGERLQRTWKGDFFARCLINRSNAAGTTYLGARGDGLSADPAIPGTYFLNSFSWSVLAGVATEEQIGTMLARMEDVLMTPVGLRLASPCRYDLITRHTGSGDYLYGDRENGAVFKHANMMAAFAMLEAARRVRDHALAERLASLAWKVLQATAPFVAFDDPYRLAGNPRFCTQYTNPATREHIGPLLSGTAPWMWLSYLSLFGVRFREGGVHVDPLLPASWRSASLDLNVPAGRYRIEISKPSGFFRCADGEPEVLVNGAPGGRDLPPAPAGETSRVRLCFG